MKTVFYAAILVTVLLTASSSSAQTENLLGVYFDADGTNNCLEEFPPHAEQYQIYVVLQNPTMPSITGIGYLIEGFDSLLCIGMIFSSPQALNTCDPQSHVCAGFGEPFVLSASTVIVTYTIYSSPNNPESVCMNMVGSFMCPDQSRPTLYLDDEFNYIHPNLEPGPGNGCMASIGTCLVATDSGTWEGLKSLYR